ncbi:hypothetical protein D3C83_214630 [compost metagenome]
MNHVAMHQAFTVAWNSSWVIGCMTSVRIGTSFFARTRSLIFVFQLVASPHAFMPPSFPGLS